MVVDCDDGDTIDLTTRKLLKNCKLGEITEKKEIIVVEVLLMMNLLSSLVKKLVCQ